MKSEKFPREKYTQMNIMVKRQLIYPSILFDLSQKLKKLKTSKYLC